MILNLIQKTLSKGNNGDKNAIFVSLLIVVLILMACLAPGILCVKLLDLMVDFESTGWMWTWSIALSLVVYLICRSNDNSDSKGEKAYVAISVAIIAVFFIWK